MGDGEKAVQWYTRQGMHWACPATLSSSRFSPRKGASTSEMGRFETEFLTQEDNRQALARMNTRWVERAMAHTLHQRVILDMDSSESPVHGQQEGAAYNGHFE